VIRLDIGSPDLTPSGAVLRAPCDAAKRSDCHRYPGYRGLAAFRQAVAAYYRDRFGLTVDPDSHVVPLIGSKEGIVNMALALLDPGDVVLVPDPCYAPYVAG
jgi:LL-diaminopimelate aminotransferase